MKTLFIILCFLMLFGVEAKIISYDSMNYFGPFGGGTAELRINGTTAGLVFDGSKWIFSNADGTTVEVKTVSTNPTIDDILANGSVSTKAVTLGGISADSAEILLGFFNSITADTVTATTGNFTGSVTAGIFYGDISHATGYVSTSEVFIEGTQGVQVKGNSIVFDNAGVERIGDNIHINMQQSGGGSSFSPTLDYIKFNDWFILSEKTKEVVLTPDTGELVVFMDKVSKQPAIKNWLGRCYRIVLRSLKDIIFLFNTGTYTDYTYSGTYATNWNASSDSIFNVNNLENPSGSPYALTLQTKVTRLVDISSITPTGFAVEYGPYDAGGIKYGLVGNSGLLYGLGSDSANNWDCTQNSSTDFLESNWTNQDSTNVSLTASSVVITDAMATNKIVNSTSAVSWTDVSIYCKFEIDDNYDTIGIGFAKDPTQSYSFYYNTGSAKNVAVISFSEVFYRSYYTSGGSATTDTISSSGISSPYWVKIHLYNYTGTTYDWSYWLKTTEYDKDDDWGTPTGTITGCSCPTGDLYVGVGGLGGLNQNGGEINTVYINTVKKDTSGTWIEKKYINGDTDDWLNIESVVNSKISIFKSNTSATLLGPYVSMKSGTTGEIESINISY